MDRAVFSHRDDCRLCGSERAEVAVRLHPVPVKTPNLGDGDEVDRELLVNTRVPLNLYRCLDCGLIQLLDRIDPRVQYRDFRYRTSISLGLPLHFQQMADQLIERYAIGEKAFVFEIGSNDGTLLSAFQERGAKVLGVDPSQPVSEVARSRGVPTITDFFDAGLGERIAVEEGRAGLVICNNTFANIDDLSGFLQGVRAVLAIDGLFVMETGYGLPVIENFLIDTVYHEHLSYFLVASLDQQLPRYGLELVDAEPVATKGGSLRVAIQHRGGDRARSERIEPLIEREHASGIFHEQPFVRFAAHLEEVREALHRAVDPVRSAGGRIAGYGASVGTITLLYQLGVGAVIDFFVDENPLADSIELPGRQLPVMGRDALLEERPDLVVIFAVRYAELIVEKNRDYLAAGGRFVVPFPRFRVIGGES